MRLLLNGNSLIKTAAAVCVFLFLAENPAVAGQKTFGFIDTRYVITAEVAGEHSFVLNFINLSDFVIVVQPNQLIYKGVAGRFYIGQVFQKETKDFRGEKQKYTASFLLRGHSFAGLTVLGAFHELDDIEELSVRIGAKRFYLQPMEKGAFERLADKIGALDIKTENPAAVLAEADLQEMGRATSTDGTSEWDRDWNGFFMQDGVNPPRIIERPEISPTIEAKKANSYGKVKLSGIVNRSGGVQDLKVIKGLGKGLDERAMEGVRNSWVFLPATKNGEVLDGLINFDVEFPAPERK
jgi:TonB family protein